MAATVTNQTWEGVDKDVTDKAIFKSHVVRETWVGFKNQTNAAEFMHMLPDAWRYRIVEVREFDLSGPKLCYLVLPTEVQIP